LKITEWKPGLYLMIGLALGGVASGWWAKELEYRRSVPPVGAC
jgi:hypothetical protein